MGIIDKVNWNLTCPKCNATDTVSARQKGSAWSVGEWSDISASTQFEIESKPGIDGPDLESATCKACKVPAQVK